MSQNTPALEYLAPDVSEMTLQRGGVGSDPLKDPNGAQNQMTRTVARRLLPALTTASRSRTTLKRGG